MTKLIAIRHPRPDVGPGICYGWLDVPLLDDPLPSRIDRIGALESPRFYTSPSQRCRLFAEAIAEHPVCVEPRIMELHFGDWEGRAWTAIDREASERWIADLDKARVPGGESFQDLSTRTADFLESLQPGRDSVIVTHAGVIRRLLCWERSMSLADAFAIPVDYESTWEFSLHDLRKLLAPVTRD